MKTDIESIPNLYSITGNVLDINTVLINREELRKLIAEQQASELDYSICPSCGGMASDPIAPVEARQEPVAIPPDASPTEWRDAVWKVWKLARTGNNTIPSHWLDAMREMAIAATNPAPTQQDGNTVGVALRSLTLRWGRSVK